MYCCNEHNVGHITRSTYANQGILFYRLTAEKTTWRENYLDKSSFLLFEFIISPEFVNSIIIQEKPIGTTRPLMPCEKEIVEKYS